MNPVILRKIKLIRDDILKNHRMIDNEEDVDLDQIFDEIKSERKKKQQNLHKSISNNKVNERDPNRRYTEDGIPIYTEEELGLNNPKAGTTPLCPFDCDCCY